MKILIIHASAGAGHTKAAEAILSALKKDFPQHHPQIVDALDFTSPSYKMIYKKSYAFLVTRMPWLWGFFFHLVDIPVLRSAVRFFRRGLNHLNAWRLEAFLVKEDFDWIFSTHFLPNEVSASLKRKNLIHSKIVCVVTDFDVHSIWTAEAIDFYAGACDFTKERLLELGIVQGKIRITGIPTDSKFSRQQDKRMLRKGLGLKEDVFTVLVATGSFGIGPIEKIIETLSGVQVVVVCGHNQKLFDRLRNFPRDLVKICGLVDNMDELMALSDCMVTKPGGLSISEALVSRLPLIFFNAIPGQETHNIQVLRRYGLGTQNCSVEELSKELKDLSSSPQRLIELRENSLKLASPGAASRIINLIHEK